MNTIQLTNDNAIEKKQAYISLIRGTHTETFLMKNLLTIGRDSNSTIHIDDPFISTRHAKIEYRNNGFTILDLRSSNGTYLNGTKVFEAELSDQDRIQIGNIELIFSFKKSNEEEHSYLTSKNPRWNNELQKFPLIARSPLPVIINGPSGTGKEVLAQMLHQRSSRTNGPFVSVNCSALNENLIESELFGHIKGSFTGATQDRKGAFEAAHGGTLFLDEIGDLPLNLQPKLLRALENNEIKPVGCDKVKLTDVRVIAATHKSLKKLVSQKEFREDLYYRLNILKITPPSLINRLEDFDHLLYLFAKKYRVSFSHSCIEGLKTHPWPGNIRELKNFVARAGALFPKGKVNYDDAKELIEDPIQKKDFFSENQMQSKSILKEIEKNLITERLKANHGNQRKTATDLGMPKSTLHDRIKKYEINIQELISS